MSAENFEKGNRLGFLTRQKQKYVDWWFHASSFSIVHKTQNKV
jgi:hypothetical protein